MSDVCTLCTTIKKSNFEELLERDRSVSIHHQNIRFLAIEMFKVFRDIGLQIVEEIFQFRDAMRYELRKQTNLKIPSVHSVFSGKESLTQNLGNFTS